MNRKMVLTGLAAVTLAAASAAPAGAQGFGVSVGFGAPGWGYDNWNYGSYAAAPCTCATRYRTERVAPSYRYSSSTYGGYPYDSDYAYYPYDDSYGGTYASVGFGWSDDGWRGRRWRDRDRDRFTREDRVRVSNRDFRDGR